MKARNHSTRREPAFPPTQPPPTSKELTGRPRHRPPTGVTASWSLFFGIGLLSVRLSVQAADPELVPTLPLDHTVSVGGTIILSTAVNSTHWPLTYQWQHNGTNLVGANQSNLRLSQVTEMEDGQYRAIVQNAIGNFATSRVATVRVDRTFRKVTGQPIVEDREATEVGAWADYDGDGDLDLFAANSVNGEPAVRNSLYRNDNGHFTRITNAITRREVNTWAALWADYDNDGRPDLFLTHYGGAASELYRNLGGGEFAAVSTPFQLSSPEHRDGAWCDLDGDGWVDLLATTAGFRRDQALRNLGDGKFQPLTTNEVGDLVGDPANSLSMTFADFDNDGDPDAYTSNGSGRAFLYRNRGGGRFERTQLGSLPTPHSTVGGVWADFNNDGWFDLLTTDGNDFCILHMNVGGQAFEDVTVKAGLTTVRGSVFGPAWGDLDNDGDLDLFIPFYNSTNMMFLNQGDGTFQPLDVGNPLREGQNDESAVWVDYDNDGFLDLFVAAGEANPSPNLLYQNNLPATGNTNRWLEVKLVGTTSNRSGIGAKIRVRSIIKGKQTWQLRQIASDGAFASGSQLVAHFGLGDAAVADLVRIEWPSGTVQDLANVSPNQILTITEPRRPALAITVGATQVTGTLTGDPGEAYQVQVAADLGAGWTLVGAVTTDANGQGTWSEAVIASGGIRFYRALKAP